jgi:hypothetical protein
LTDMPTLTSRRPSVRSATFVAFMLILLSAAVGHAQSIPRKDVLYIHPFWMTFPTASATEVESVFADMRSRLGADGPHVKLGIAVYLSLSMEDWNVDISNPAAVRGAMNAST